MSLGDEASADLLLRMARFEAEAATHRWDGPRAVVEGYEAMTCSRCGCDSFATGPCRQAGRAEP